MKVLQSSFMKTKPLESNRSSHSVSDITSERSKQVNPSRNKTPLDWFNLTGNLRVVCSLSLLTELARRNKDHSDMVKSISRDLRESLIRTLPSSFWCMNRNTDSQTKKNPRRSNKVNIIESPTNSRIKIMKRRLELMSEST